MLSKGRESCSGFRANDEVYPHETLVGSADSVAQPKLEKCMCKRVPLRMHDLLPN